VPRAKGTVSIDVSRELRDKIRELSMKLNLSYEELISKALEAYTLGTTLGNECLPTDCVARRVYNRRGEPERMYFIECKGGSKALIPDDTLADLARRFKISIKVVEK
jgi:hypothetical protein